MVGSVLNTDIGTGDQNPLLIDDFSEDDSDIEERMLCVTSARGMLSSQDSARNKKGELISFTDRNFAPGASVSRNSVQGGFTSSVQTPRAYCNSMQ